MAQKFLRSTIGQITSASGRRILASRAAALLIKVYDCRVQALAWEGGEYPYLASFCRETCNSLLNQNISLLSFSFFS
jgi:hypothetical protein